jgi:serine-type D-Ala-D-Ala carboxypeptidase/endopeptidase (penicillin-binding protein 4)
MTSGIDTVSRRWLLSALAATAAAPACARAPEVSKRPTPRPALGAVAAAPRSTGPAAEVLVETARLGGQVTYAVADARSGQMLEARGADLTQPPASVSKAMTSLYALESLGSGYRFTTRLIATGPVQGGRVQGDLVLAGGGDPELSTDDLGEMAARLRAAGVTEVSGRFLVWGGALPLIGAIDTAQPDHVGYNPAIAGLNLNYNRVHFEWKRAGQGYQVTMDARGERFRPQVGMARMQVVNRAAPLYTFANSGGVENWTVAQGALGNAGSRWLPVRRPDLYAGEVFQALARAQGVSLPSPSATQGLPNGTVILAHQSGELRTILRTMMRWSTNLTAEAVGLAASSARGARPSSLVDSARQMSGWAGSRLQMSGPRFVDHSGLGGASRIAAADMVRGLVRADPSLKGLMRDYPMRDGRGNEMRNHPVKVAAKTGTLNFVSGLGGYITAPGGTELVFAIFSADVARRDSLNRAQYERPQGGREWTARARNLQQQLIQRWASMYG